MRNAFFRALFGAAHEDDRIVLVVGDLGFSLVESFAERFPDRFINVGVAEQNMIGLAAGLALGGRIAVVYSIGNFPLLRCLEQVRNDVCYHRANVKIVSVGGGFAYGALGFSHHATEDLAIARSLPNLTVIAPGDPVEATHATRQMLAAPGPCYMRLGRSGDPVVHSPQIEFALGRALTVRNGRDLTLIATGGMLPTAVEVAKRLGAWALEARVLSMHTVKPLDTHAVTQAAQETGTLVTLEEHQRTGGLGGAVAEALCASRLSPVSLLRFGIDSLFSSVAGSQEYLRAVHGLSPEGILAALEPIVAELADRKRDAAHTS